MNEGKSDTSLLRELSALGFVLLELHLYLDTHPRDVNALNLFTQYRAKYLEVLDEYERAYGPVTAVNGVSGNTWKWVEDPWPWETDANVEVR